MSDKLPALVRPFEGCRLVAYRCPAGRWTIGWGHTSAAGSPFVTEGLRISQAQADAILARDLEAVRVAVAKLCVGAKRGCAEEELDAFASLAFNIGIDAFSKSTALRKYRRGDKAGAADAILLWNRATVDDQLVVVNDLVRRRQAERALFLEGHAAAEAAVAGQYFGAMPQEVARPVQRKPVTRSQTAHAAAGVSTGGALFAFEGAKQAIGVMSDAKAQAAEAATVFGVPEESAVLVGGGILILVAAAFIVWRRYRRSIEDLVYSTVSRLHLPFLADEAEADASEVETAVSVEATHVEATVETDERVIQTSTAHIQAEVASVAAPVVAAVEPVAVKAEATAAAVIAPPVEAAITPFVENGPGITSFVAPARVLSEPVAPAPAAIVAWPGAGARS